VSVHLFSPYLQHGSDKNLLRCAWSPDGEMVTVGSADRAVHVWDVPSTQELYFLPGHKGTVNEVSSKSFRQSSEKVILIRMPGVLDGLV
jgi:WD40 repeat protein